MSNSGIIDVVQKTRVNCGTVTYCSLPGVTLAASSVCTRKSVYARVLPMYYVCIGLVYTKCVHITYIGVCSCII